jgi:micrococcal nuclease
MAVMGISNDQGGRRRKRSSANKRTMEAAWRREAARAGAGRLRRPRRRQRWNPSGVTILNMVMIVFLLAWFRPELGSQLEYLWGTHENTQTSAYPTDLSAARFAFCHSGGGTNCVVDGDTFWMHGNKYRIADIDTPETHPPRCEAEAVLGKRATDRLQALLNDGPFTLEKADRDTDRYGRRLRVVTRDGESIGGMLVAEGLARPWGGHRDPWC